MSSRAAFLALITGQNDNSFASRSSSPAENRILRSQATGRLQLDDEQRVALAIVGKPLTRSVLDRLATIVTDTYLIEGVERRRFLV